MVNLSVVVLTKNEEANIAECLDSVSGWADEIIVVDDGSTDKTLDIVSKYTNKIIKRRMDVEGIHRNFAYAQAKNEWVLSLDADEKVSEELKREVSEVLKPETKYAAFSIPLRNFIGTYWVRHGGWYPAGKVRLFRKDKFKYEEVKVHPRAFIDGECGHLTKDIVHKGYPDLAHFLDSLNRQTSWEAEKWFNQNKPMRLGRFFYRTIDRFMRTYVGKKGYKDGFYGFVIAFYAGLYQFMSYLKYQEILIERRNKE
ncbi:MAG: glycosyltransferase family 2 protein [Candidatus Omnitrophica bacterium]|nr:glycosyltransferase family 2 protein [Candidatus Omnitrophota bacterium]